MRITFFICLLAFLCPLAAEPSAATRPPSAVVVLANRDDRDSVELARYYASRRGLPDTAVLALSMPVTEEISWSDFVATIWNPLVREAVARGWLLASLSGDFDAVGRLRLVSAGHRLEALVLCRGVPLRIAHDPAHYDPKTNPLTSNPAFQTTEASVDSELALLATDNAPIAAFIPNPLFEQEHPQSFVLEQILPVGRLDGPTLDDAKALVDNALEAERNGVAGRAYLDLGGPHAQGDEWLAACLPELTSLGFETDVDREPGVLPTPARSDAPAFYFGWYAGDLCGPFAAPGFRFPPGAVALHIHSFSAATLHSATRGWVGPLVAKGATATCGNVGEPYLQFTHQPQLLLRALARGEPLGRAALYSIKVLSWKGVLIGDPLYRPFAVSAEAQWERRAELPSATESYARIRRMRLVAAAGRVDEAIGLGMSGLRKNPGLPLALTLADLQLGAGDAAASRRSLAIFGLLPSWRPIDYPLVAAAARTCQAAGDATAGARLIERLLAVPTLTPEFRISTLRQGVEVARAANDPLRAARWDAEHAKLTAPPPAPASPAAKP